jgi:hypothetical protein
MSYSNSQTVSGGVSTEQRAGRHPLAPRFSLRAVATQISLVESRCADVANLRPSDTRARQHRRFSLSWWEGLALATMLGLFLPTPLAFTNGTSRTNHQIGLRCGNCKYCDSYRITGDHRGAPLRDALVSSLVGRYSTFSNAWPRASRYLGNVGEPGPLTPRPGAPSWALLDERLGPNNVRTKQCWEPGWRRSLQVPA